MPHLVDSSSLLQMVRYYLPLDKQGKLHALLSQYFAAEKLVIIDAVLAEVRSLAGGIVMKKFPFLADKKIAKPTADLFPDAAMNRRIDAEFKSKAGDNLTPRVYNWC